MDRYTCEQADLDMDAYLDRELGTQATRQVSAHLETCAGCGERFRSEADLLSEVRTKLKRIQVPPTLLRRVRACLQEAG